MDGWEERVGEGKLSTRHREILEKIQVPISKEDSADLWTVIFAWDSHVTKLQEDLSPSSHDGLIWGAHDFVAALYMRDFVEMGILSLKGEVRQRTEAFVAKIDQGFLAFTEADEQGVVEVIDGRANKGRGWWWKRIPKLGPVRDEMERW